MQLTLSSPDTTRGFAGVSSRTRRMGGLRTGAAPKTLILMVATLVTLAAALLFPAGFTVLSSKNSALMYSNHWTKPAKAWVTTQDSVVVAGSYVSVK